MLKIVFKLCCCLGFANHDSQTKKTTSWKYIRLFTVHSTVCTIYARANHHKETKGEDLCDNYFVTKKHAGSEFYIRGVSLHI